MPHAFTWIHCKSLNLHWMHTPIWSSPSTCTGYLMQSNWKFDCPIFTSINITTTKTCKAKLFIRPDSTTTHKLVQWGGLTFTTFLFKTCMRRTMREQRAQLVPGKAFHSWTTIAYLQHVFSIGYYYYGIIEFRVFSHPSHSQPTTTGNLYHCRTSYGV